MNIWTYQRKQKNIFLPSTQLKKFKCYLHVRWHSDEPNFALFAAWQAIIHRHHQHQHQNREIEKRKKKKKTSKQNIMKRRCHTTTNNRKLSVYTMELFAFRTIICTNTNTHRTHTHRTHYVYAQAHVLLLCVWVWVCCYYRLVCKQTLTTCNYTDISPNLICIWTQWTQSTFSCSPGTWNHVHLLVSLSSAGK